MMVIVPVKNDCLDWGGKAQKFDVFTMKIRRSTVNGDRRLRFAQEYKGLMVLIPVQKTLYDLFWLLFLLWGCIATNARVASK